MPLSVDACFSEPSGLIIRESGFSRTVADRPIFPTANIAKVECHAKRACSVLHGRDASCVRRQANVAKVGRRANGLARFAMPSRILCSPAGQCSESRAQSQAQCKLMAEQRVREAAHVVNIEKRFVSLHGHGQEIFFI